MTAKKKNIVVLFSEQTNKQINLYKIFECKYFILFFKKIFI